YTGQARDGRELPGREVDVDVEVLALVGAPGQLEPSELLHPIRQDLVVLMPDLGPLIDRLDGPGGLQVLLRVRQERLNLERDVEAHPSVEGNEPRQYLSLKRSDLVVVEEVLERSPHGLYGSHPLAQAVEHHGDPSAAFHGQGEVL